MNTNCLANFKCPQCGSEDPFRVEAYTMIVLEDSGVEDYGPFEWGDDCYASCVSCGHEGIVRDFTAKEYKA